MNTLKELYNLKPDNSGLSTGLINWYNQVINKTYEELDVTDVSKMYRQEIALEIVVNKAIDLILINPYDGEYTDGGLLELITRFELSMIENSKLLKLTALLERLNSEYLSFDWCCDEDMSNFKTNLEILMNRIIR
ncbi:MAG: hypothetical protein K0S18_2316 [Anaerocolumna sp.]|jgi:hypothetical protein|nr:hypothetical protein [Anaerocolumna sp.]